MFYFYGARCRSIKRRRHITLVVVGWLSLILNAGPIVFNKRIYGDGEQAVSAGGGVHVDAFMRYVILALTIKIKLENNKNNTALIGSARESVANNDDVRN